MHHAADHAALQDSFSLRPCAAGSVSVSAQDGIVALGKTHMLSAPHSLPKIALETVPICIWLNTDRSRTWRLECQPLPFSSPLSFSNEHIVWSPRDYISSGLKGLHLFWSQRDYISSGLKGITTRLVSKGLHLFWSQRDYISSGLKGIASLLVSKGLHLFWSQRDYISSGLKGIASLLVSKGLHLFWS